MCSSNRRARVDAGCGARREQEEVVTITMNKYRKAQTMIEEADHRADMAEKNVTTMRGRTRSMSVTREITRVVRI